MRVVAQVRILDSCENLRNMQWQMRRHAHGLAKLAKLRVIPDVAVRELLATMKKRELHLADELRVERLAHLVPLLRVVLETMVGSEGG